MKTFINTRTLGLRMQNQDLALVREFLHLHGTALADAAHRLGGRTASARVFLLIEALRGATRLTRLQRRQLIKSHELLSLKNVGDPDRVETALFAEIDPGSRWVEDCCRLADCLKHLLVEIAATDEEQPTAAQAASTRNAA